MVVLGEGAVSYERGTPEFGIQLLGLVWEVCSAGPGFGETGDEP